MGWKDTIELLTLIVLALTLVEIARTRRIDAQQKDLQLLPAMMFNIHHHSGTERLFIKNIGFGSATAVRVLPSTFTVGSQTHEYRFHLVGYNTMLAPSEEREVGINFFLNGQPEINSHHHIQDFMAYHNPENLEMVNAAGEAGLVNDIETPAQREIIVQFRDLTAQKYQTTLLFSGVDISVAKAPKRVERGDEPEHNDNGLR